MSSPNPAECLGGELLDGEWRVLNRESRHPAATGGHFSVCYLVKNEVTNQTAFLKAFDFSGAFQAPDFARELQSLTAAFNFERDLLARCSSSNMRRVLTPVADGVHRVASCPGPLQQVHYLIFDLAEGDIRKHAAELNALDLAWCLRSLHHTATGIQELHSQIIIHQDLKLSNILTFGSKGTKISDLGRGFSPDHPVEHDHFAIPGDRTYSPPELFYGLITKRGIEGRKAIDVYSLGSLVFFHFMGISATQGMYMKLRQQNAPLSGTDFERDLPLFQRAFGDLLVELQDAILLFTAGLCTPIVKTARELCAPDPERRGDPRTRARGSGSAYAVERYISRFNLLARRAELGLT